MNFSWESSDSLLLFNPSYSKKDQEFFQIILKSADAWPAHLWLSTSGSSAVKWVGLSKQAILASAESVNKHLESDEKDRWIKALPDFHVGGIGIWARAYLSGAKVYDFKQAFPGKWQAENFYRFIQEKRGTLTALVPTQLYDLAVLGWQAPSSLRAVIIGGGVLLPHLYEQAIALNWPILPSYGLTECASQVATAPLNSWKEKNHSLQLLMHIQACEKEGRLCFKGPSLLSTYVHLENHKVNFIDPKVEGWFTSEDRGSIHYQQLNVAGRSDSMIKIGGENVDLAHLDTHLQTLRLQLKINGEVILLAVPDSRVGYVIQAASDSLQKEEVLFLIDQFQHIVLPFEKIRKIHFFQQIPRSPLGKVLKGELLKLIHFSLGISL